MPRPITSAGHGLIDYPVGLLLITAPVIFETGLIGERALVASAILLGFGVLVVLQGLLTDYELSVVDLIPLRAHLAFDVVAGIILAVSPLVLGFADQGAAWLPHVIIGCVLIAAGLLTQTPRAASPAEGSTRAPAGGGVDEDAQASTEPGRRTRER